MNKKSKVLLVNFSHREEEVLKNLGLGVDTGWLSNALNEGGDSSKQNANFYAPLAIHEYDLIVLRLTKNPPTIVLEQKAERLSYKEKQYFVDYWQQDRGILIIFNEQSNFFSLKMLGIPFMSLEDSSKKDKTINCFDVTPGLSDKKFLRDAIKRIQPLISIPPQKYIFWSNSEFEIFRENFAIRPLYENLGNERIGAFLHSGELNYYDDNPRSIILPALRDYVVGIEVITKALGKIFPSLISINIDNDWQNKDKYYPRDISEMEKEKEKITKTVQEELKEIEARKERAKKKYSHLLDLLTSQGDELKGAVRKTLSDSFGFKVKDADSENKSQLAEDLIIEDSEIDLAVLAEVKGTQNKNPTLKFITQAATNWRKSGKSNAIGALILNHDLNNIPEERTTAYSTKEEKETIEASEIIYIDTRKIFELVLEIINKNITKEKARKLLFNIGEDDPNTSKSDIK